MNRVATIFGARPRGFCAVALGLLLVLGGGSLAFGRSAKTGTAARGKVTTDVDEIDRLLGQARVALTEKKRDQAAALAAQAYRLGQPLAALSMLAEVAWEEGRVLDAQDLAQRYILDPELEQSEQVLTVRRMEILLRGERPPSASLSILGDRGALVVVDKRLVGALPLAAPLLVTPGDHRIELLTAGKRIEDQVRMPVGRLGELRVDAGSGATVFSLLSGLLLVDGYEGVAFSAQEKFRRELDRKIYKLRRSPIGHETVFQSLGEPAPRDCQAALSCVRDLAQKLALEQVVFSSASRSATGYQLTATLYAVDIAEPTAQATTDCAGCTEQDAARKLAGLLDTLWAKQSDRTRGQLALQVMPAGARVWLDEVELGQTPLLVAAWTGQKTLRIEELGYRPFRQQVQIQEGRVTTIETQLESDPEPVPAPLLTKQVTRTFRARRPTWRIVTGLSSMALGGVMAGIGISGLLLDGACVPADSCLRTLTTRAPGLGLTIPGSALFLGGAALLAWPGRMQQVQEEVPLSQFIGFPTSSSKLALQLRF